MARPLLHALYRPYVLARLPRAGETRVHGFSLRTDPQVFHPGYFFSSRILAEQLCLRPLRGVRVLDMGTGAGPIAVVAAAAGAVVTAVDRNPRAVALAQENLTRNGLRAEVLESDLFSALEGRRFALQCFNIPFYPRDPVSHYDAAWNAGRGFETVRRFARGALAHLESEGRVLVLFSEDTPRQVVLSAFSAAGLVLESEQVTRRGLEDFHTVCFRRASG